jgi:uncharacterized protein (TIGR03067 family)
MKTPSSTIDDDARALEGTWRQVACEDEGAAGTVDELDQEGTLTTFRDNHFSVRAADGRVLLEGRFELDASVAPKAITWIDASGADKGKRLPASYALAGDRFEFVAADEGCPRPARVCGGPGLTLRRFVRWHAP